MLSSKMQEALNEQVNAEMYSAYIYLSMGAWFEEQNLSGFANWMKVQAQEEMAHAMKIYGFIFERGGKVAFKAIDAPPAEWDSPTAVFQHVLEHEQKVTGLINNLVDLAEQENDRATCSFLQWFVDEQVEEEASADQVVKQLEMVGDSPGPMFMLNNLLGQRQTGGQ